MLVCHLEVEYVCSWTKENSITIVSMLNSFNVIEEEMKEDT